jgi:hypothetical protein
MKEALSNPADNRILRGKCWWFVYTLVAGCHRADRANKSGDSPDISGTVRLTRK